MKDTLSALPGRLSALVLTAGCTVVVIIGVYILSNSTAVHPDDAAPRVPAEDRSDAS